MKILLGATIFAVGVTGMSSSAYAVRHYFYAACHHGSHGLLGYSGKRHADAADAQMDCDAHLKIYPRHRCVIEPIDY